MTETEFVAKCNMLYDQWDPENDEDNLHMLRLIEMMLITLTGRAYTP